MSTNARGNVLQRVSYKPFGEALVEEGEVPNFGFTGQRFEATTGLYDYGARFYDPAR